MASAVACDPPPPPGQIQRVSHDVPVDIVQQMVPEAAASSALGLLVKGVVHHTCLDVCLVTYRDLVDTCIGALRSMRQELGATVADKTDWFNEFTLFTNNTRSALKTLCVSWAKTPIREASELTEILETMEDHHSEYFAFLFCRDAEEDLYIELREERLFFSSEPLTASNRMANLKMDVLSAAEKKLETFAVIRRFISWLQDGDGSFELQEFIPDSAPKVALLKSAVQNLSSTDRGEFVRRCVDVKQEYIERCRRLEQFSTAEEKSAFEALNREVQMFRKAIVQDLPTLQRQYKKCRKLLEMLAVPGSGVPLAIHNGLPTSWPVAIKDPFSDTTIVLGKPKELRMWESIDKGDFENYLVEAMVLNYSRIAGDAVEFIKPAYDFICLRQQVQSLTSLLAKYSLASEDITRRIMGLEIPNWSVAE